MTIADRQFDGMFLWDRVLGGVGVSNPHLCEMWGTLFVLHEQPTLGPVGIAEILPPVGRQNDGWVGFVFSHPFAK